MKIMIKGLGTILLAVTLTSFACSKDTAGTIGHVQSGSDKEGNQQNGLKAQDVLGQTDTIEKRYNVQVTEGKLESTSRFEEIPAGEDRLIRDMAEILQGKMSRDYPNGRIRRDAHPKNLACLQAEFKIEPNIPTPLQVGIFAAPQTYSAWIRISSASSKIQSDKVKDVRGFAIKIMGVEGERFERHNGEQETQDFIMMSYPVMPLGTVELFHDALYYSIKWSPVVFFFRLVLSGNFHILNELRKARQNQTSPLDIRYWSTTPYLCGPDNCVKYSLVPTSPLKSSLPEPLTDEYLTENMENHLAADGASFDFMMQLQQNPDRMPVEDAGVLWSEDDSPFIKVATLRIPAQVFRTGEREELAEDLSFSPAHSLMAHRPIGGLNRARVEIYRILSEFRHQQNNKSLEEPST